MARVITCTAHEDTGSSLSCYLCTAALWQYWALALDLGDVVLDASDTWVDPVDQCALYVWTLG